MATCDDLELAAAEREVEVLGLLEAHLADDLGEERRAGELLVREVVLLERLLERLAAALLGDLPRLAAEPLADLVAARDEAASESQSRDGPRLACFEVRISTKSPLCRR